MTAPRPIEVEYFFTIGSPWAYFGALRLLELAERLGGVTVNPFIIPIIEENGGISLFKRPAIRQQYFYQEVARWSEFLGIPVRIDLRPALRDPMPAAMMVVAAGVSGADGLQLALALQQAFWQGADIAVPSVRSEIATRSGFDGQALLDMEGRPDIVNRWQRNRDMATHRGVFGAPTFVVEGEMFWGQDRLDFVERHILKLRGIA